MASLSIQGRKLLGVLIAHLNRHKKTPDPDHPETLIGYGETLEQLNLPVGAPRGPTDGKTLQLNGLNDLAKWVKDQPGMPRITGLIVSRSPFDEDDGAKRAKNMPGKGYFKEYRKDPEDYHWWLGEMRESKDFDWSPYLDAQASTNSHPAKNELPSDLPGLKAVTDDAALVNLEAEDEALINSAPETMRAAVRLSRIGQGHFRREVIALRKCCCLTKVSDPRLLRASHIKPWRSSSHVERLDPHNGLLLTPTLDHLFDLCLISFADDGTLLISSNLPLQTLRALGVDSASKSGPFPAATRVYLCHHRTLFQKAVHS